MKISAKNSLLAWALLILLAFGCKKDDNSKGSFTYDGKSYNFTNGFLAKWITVNDTTVYALFLYNGFQVHLTGDAIDSIYGKGSGIELAFVVTTDSSGLAEGDYKYDATLSDAFTFYGGALNIAYDYADNSGFSSLLTDGSFTVKRSGSSHNITFGFMDDDSKTIVGNYNGKLPVYQIILKKSAERVRHFR